ncbi:MAG: ribulose phosphate epimerase, partial [Gammaproteobacteria bacterium]|nr:ribulose phosphate epimerase [Gammaproteobacteria bacterium]
MNRRTILKGMLGASGAAAMGFRLPLASAADDAGKLYVFVQANGGWDPTSFCDPKVNVSGEPIINNWAQRAEVHEAGNIAYAPFANNEAFFEKYYERMLVVNGVDAQTNSHTVGVVHNWSGRTSEGYPTATALLAGHYAPDLSVPYLSFGGYSETGGVARFTRMNNPDLLRNIATPQIPHWNADLRYVSDADWSALESRRAQAAQRLVDQGELLPTQARNREFYRSAFAAADGLAAYAAALPPNDELEQPETYAGANYT